MSRARDVAQAVAKTRSSWSCMGERCRTMGGSGSHSKMGDDDDRITQDSLLVEETSSRSLTNKVEEEEEECVVSAETVMECHSNQDDADLYNSTGGDDSTDEERELIGSTDRRRRSSISGVQVRDNNVETEGDLWYELEKELQRHEAHPDVVEAKEEEAAAAAEIIEEENVVADDSVRCSLDELECHRFYPPGRIMHMVPLSSSSDPDADRDLDGGASSSSSCRVGIFETPRQLYSKIRLSKTMINDHYMPMYKKMMELLIKNLDNDDVV